jgi:hypothetical protein
MTKKQEMQRLYHHYREITGRCEVTMHDVAKFALSKGWPMPAPVDPIDRLAKEFAEAAREEIRHDKSTGKPYRANHAFAANRTGRQLTFWIDIDQAPRKSMLKSAVQRREQVVGDVLQLSLDLDHWNSVNPSEEAIVLPLDFTDDVEWRKNAPDERAG